jgi:translation initiation factor IF-2
MGRAAARLEAARSTLRPARSCSSLWSSPPPSPRASRSRPSRTSAEAMVSAATVDRPPSLHSRIVCPPTPRPRPAPGPAPPMPRPFQPSAFRPCPAPRLRRHRDSTPQPSGPAQASPHNDSNRQPTSERGSCERLERHGDSRPQPSGPAPPLTPSPEVRTPTQPFAHKYHEDSRPPSLPATQPARPRPQSQPDPGANMQRILRIFWGGFIREFETDFHKF